MTNVAKLGAVLAARFHGIDVVSLAFVTHINEDGTVDLIGFPAGSLHPAVALAVPVYDSESAVNDAEENDDEVPAVIAFWPDDSTGSDVKPPKKSTGARSKSGE